MAVKRSHLFLFLLLVLPFHTLLAQTDSTETMDDEDDEGFLVIPPLNEKMKLGVKLGCGLYMMSGPEVPEAYPVFGLNGGLYFRYRIGKHFNLQPELNISFRGSKFDHKDGEYGTIRSYFIDLPLLVMYGLNEKNTSNIVAGAQYAYLINSTAFGIRSDFPEELAPRLSKHDVMLVAGAQFATPFVGFQLLVKYGLLNANKGMVTTLPPADTGKEVHHIAFEFDFMF